MKKIIMFAILLSAMVMLSNMAYGNSWADNKDEYGSSYSIADSNGNLLSLSCFLKEVKLQVGYDKENVINLTLDSNTINVANEKTWDNTISSILNSNVIIAKRDGVSYKFQNKITEKEKADMFNSCSVLASYEVEERIGNTLISFEDSQNNFVYNTIKKNTISKQLANHLGLTSKGSYPLGYVYRTDTIVVCNSKGTVDLYSGPGYKKDTPYSNEKLKCKNFKVTYNDIVNKEFLYFEK